MSKEFHDAEMALFMEQAKDVDIIITTVRSITYLISIHGICEYRSTGFNPW